jgi:hypothetical protein
MDAEHISGVVAGVLATLQTLVASDIEVEVTVPDTLVAIGAAFDEGGTTSSFPVAFSGGGAAAAAPATRAVIKLGRMSAEEKREFILTLRLPAAAAALAEPSPSAPLAAGAAAPNGGASLDLKRQGILSSILK